MIFAHCLCKGKEASKSEVTFQEVDYDRTTI